MINYRWLGCCFPSLIPLGLLYIFWPRIRAKIFARGVRLHWWADKDEWPNDYD